VYDARVSQRAVRHPAPARTKEIDRADSDTRADSAEHPFLKGLPPRAPAAADRCASNAKFAVGDFICREGEEANHFYILRRARSRSRSRGHRHGIVIETIGSGDVLGWSWVVAPYRWRFDARVTEPTRAWPSTQVLRGKCGQDTTGVRVAKPRAAGRRTAPAVDADAAARHVRGTVAGQAGRSLSALQLRPPLRAGAAKGLLVTGRTPGRSKSMIAMSDRERVRAVIRGAVQGRRFRPFVFRLATDSAWRVGRQLRAGWSSSGGTHAALVTFLARLDARGRRGRSSEFRSPPSWTRSLRRVRDPPERCRREDRAPCCGHRHCPTASGGVDPPTGVIGIRSQLHELRPRFTIITALPYDRPATSMAASSCATPARGVRGSADRRFHASRRLPACGPRLACGTCRAVPAPSRPRAPQGGRRDSPGLHRAIKGWEVPPGRRRARRRGVRRLRR